MTADDRTERGNARLLTDIAQQQPETDGTSVRSGGESQVAAFTAALHTLTDQQLGALAALVEDEQVRRIEANREPTDDEIYNRADWEIRWWRSIIGDAVFALRHDRTLSRFDVADALAGSLVAGFVDDAASRAAVNVPRIPTCDPQ